MNGEGNFMLAHMICFFITGILYFCLLYTLLDRKVRKYYLLFKMFSSTAFMGTAVYMGLVSGNTKNLLIMLPAFVFCYLGDYFLGVHKRVVKQIYLYLGTAAFSLGHIAFITYFCVRNGFEGYELIFPILGCVFVFFISRWDKYDFGRFRGPAFVYGAVLFTMAGKAVMNEILFPSRGNLLLAIGAIFFIISDYLIMVLYFRKKKGWTIHGWNLGTYYVAMYFMAISLFRA
ncbi:MAG: lysoplasmalogenase [Lachnospiraceae bacterium]|nr:lysoplasmalogenase [Lachnospiraceae bacterium]